MINLTEELKEQGFLCGIENEVYICDTGKYTSLIIEGKMKEDGTYLYDFYKQNFSRYSNQVKFYGKNLRPAQLLNRLDVYLNRRIMYALERRTKK